MHILLIHQAFATLQEPGGTRHFEFARILVERGHAVTVIASPVSYITGSRVANANNGSADERPESLSILRAKVYEAHHRSFVHRILAFLTFMLSSFWLGLRVRDVDLVWGTSPPIFQGVTAWLLARLKGARFVFEVRDLWPDFAVAVGVLKNRTLIRMSEWLEGTLYRHADCLVVNSPGYVEHVRQRGARRIELIPNGADPAMFGSSTVAAELRREHGLGERFVALYAGAHGMSNDLNVLIEAARLMQGESSCIVLVGDGKEKPALVERAADLDNIRFLPPAPKERMPHILAAADAGIAILRGIPAYKTTYPNKVFDYMAAGLPIVLAIDGVIRDVVEGAGCGIFAEPGNPEALARAIRQLASDREAARRMGRAGRRYLEDNFSRDKLSLRLMDVLESTLADGRLHARSH